MKAYILQESIYSNLQYTICLMKEMKKYMKDNNLIEDISELFFFLFHDLIEHLFLIKFNMPFSLTVIRFDFRI